MPHAFTSRILSVLGPSRILLVGGGHELLLTDLLLAGCDAYAVHSGVASARRPHPRCLALTEIERMSGSFDTLVIEARPGAELMIALMQLLQYTGTPRQLVLLAPGHPRRQVENGLFLLGWRRHPGALIVETYATLQDEVMGEISFYQMIPQAAALRWPVEHLQRDRNLHMDMLRESGCRADAHIVRYALAAQFIRPGDNVLDCACGLGYGTAVLAAMSRGGRFVGCDLDPKVIDYANAHYRHERLSFNLGDAEALWAIPDASVDVIVSMETIEHVPDWQTVLKEFRRILRPDGRLIASVPDRWVDATGRDPNPYHLHAFDWDKFAQGLERHFIIEGRYLQTAPGGFKLQRAPRQLQRVELDSMADSEWLLAVAAVDPLAEGKARRATFTHPAFQQAYEESQAPVVAFAEAYDNPYLYRPMVQMGERLTDNDALVHLAQRCIIASLSQSADRGAAIAVLGYRVLEDRASPKAADNARIILDHIQSYLDDTLAHQERPHVTRWRLSLSFLAGRLAALAGLRDQALVWFDATANTSWQAFSPVLATKVVAAAFQAGLLHLANHDISSARASFTRGLTLALAAGRSPAVSVIGNLDAPIPFALQEMADVLDMGGQCAVALTYLPVWRDNPGLFWQQIDLKRFGLVTWAQDLSRLNDNLMQELHKHVEVNRRLTAELQLARQYGTGAAATGGGHPSLQLEAKG